MSRPSKFTAWLENTSAPILSDGAMGTVLNARGATFDQCFDALNLSQPALVGEIHRTYIDAGSQMIQTNTFGANRYKLAAHGLEDKVKEINRAGVELARRVVMASFRDVLIAGDVGPLGVRLAPFGRVQPEQAHQVFAEQISALAEAGADLVILETFSDLLELREAVAAAREICDLPVIASMTFTRDDRTILGDAPARVALQLYESGADAIGVNCSGGPAQIWRILRQMRQALAAQTDVTQMPYFSVMPNAGWPEQVGGRIMYPANPEYFGEYALAFCEAGARIVGGCCGTTPQHIAAMRQALDKQPEGCGPSISELTLPVEAEERKTAAEQPSRLAQRLSLGRFVVSVEMDPPRGLSTHKLLAGASLLAEAGADVINVADSPMARMRMSPWAVCELIQRQNNVETVLHFPTRGRNLLRVQGDLLAAHALGIRNVFVVMGDPTAIGDYPDAMDNYDLVPSGLIKLIKQNFNAGLDHAGVDIGQPTSFFVGSALNLCPLDPEQEIKNLHRKLKAGADFLLTQPVYQPEQAEAFLQSYTDRHGPISAPILVGVLPLYGVRHASFLNNEVPGITISEETMQRLRQAGEQAPQEGVKIALELIEQMKSWASGIYLMPQFSRFDLAAEIIEGCRSDPAQFSG
ncbi:MAG: bifunctional homocysteine S-methyltransferase/methylenetetrahydrofolate reductase [Anaerolineales bacterium]|jgi:homocysteine S-methyltransferase|nr:bifunctional homocysteine S-methyltransferase/methylenetetrahydrofolate reductase [Anaerolineales bacterium]